MRKRMLNLFLAVSAAAVSAAAVGAGFSQKRDEFKDCTHLERGVALSTRGPAICVSGFVNDQLAADFIRQIEIAGRMDAKIKDVVISGPGGEVAPSIAIAKEIRGRGLNVVVGDICASACAQFLFVSGKEKYILDGGVVAFHGGPIPETKLKEMHLSKNGEMSVSYQNKLFRNFYKDSNISMDMVTKPPQEVQERIDKGELVMWSWPADKLKEFGVEKVYEERIAKAKWEP